MKVNDVLYDKRTNRFFQLVEKVDGGWGCTGFCEFYSDSQTTILRQKLSDDYVAVCEVIEFIDKCEHAYFTGIGWHVKELVSETIKPNERGS